MSKKKVLRVTEEELERRTGYAFNQGRISGDQKWIEAINNRISTLEHKVGIPELKRLRATTKYHWEIEDDEKVV